MIVTQDPGHGHHRSLCANLAAANCFTKDHIMDPENMKLILGVDYIYIGVPRHFIAFLFNCQLFQGFFLTVSPETIMELADIANQHGKTLMTNLSAQFICQFFTEPLMNLLPYVDVLYGNETEAAALSNALNFGTEDLKEIGLKIADLPKKNSKKRIVIITQGHLPVLLFNGER